MSKNKLDFEYYYGNEASGYSFFQIPKIFFKDEKLKTLSNDAKLLYSFMLDRMSLSAKNGWLDDKGRVYIYYTLEEASSVLGNSTSKAVKVMAELDTNKGIGLIERKKQGQGRPTIIYVKDFTSIGGLGTVKKEYKSYAKPKFKGVQNDKPKTSDDSNSSDYEANNSGFSYENEENQSADCENLDVKTCENDNSSLVFFESQDFSKTVTNNTYSNNTYVSDTHSINPSISPTNIERWIDGANEDDIECFVLREMWNVKSVPYEFTNNYKLMKTAIYELTEYKKQITAENGDYNLDFYFATFKVFNQALIELLTDNSTTVKGVSLTKSKIYDKFIEYVEFKNGYPTISDLQNTAIDDFTNACAEKTIKNHLAYMKSCIWNVMQVGNIGEHAMIKRDFG